MDIQFQLILLWMFAGFANAQIPSACTAVTNKQCCPNDCSGHGTCTDITSYANWGSITGPGETIVGKVNMSTETYGRQDVRFQWPTVLFTHVCKCDVSYGGPDCSDCDFGYEMMGGQCQRITVTRVRKNFVLMSEAERSDFIKVLNESKNEDPSMYQWAVVVQEPDKDGMNVQYVKTATYDFFVYHHFLVSREGDVRNLNGSSTCPDLSDVNFAHEGPSFLTWHRYYLLLLEREFGRIAERLESDNRITSNWNRYNFALPYWDWGDSDEDFNAIFSAESLGSFDNGSDKAVVTGNLFDENNWPVVCDQHYRFNLDNSTPTISCTQTRNVCNPTTDRTLTNQLERGNFLRRGTSTKDNRSLPIESTIPYLFNTNLYDYPCGNSTIYNVGASGSSFRNRVEGFVDVDESADSKFKNCGSGPQHNNFHNRVHIYIHGHMRIVPPASNDPIFYMHHNNIDRIFEKWLQKYKNSTYMPTSRTAHPGHNADDYLVPFFPLKTNRDMLKEGIEFGFEYDMVPDAAVCPFGKMMWRNDKGIDKCIKPEHLERKKLKCYGGREYSVCSGHCHPNCGDLNPVCSPDCVPGCRCPNGKVRPSDGDRSCIHVAKCPA